MTEDSALRTLLPLDAILAAGREVLAWARAHLLSADVLLQLGLVAAALLPAAVFGPRLRHLIEQNVSARVSPGPLRRLLDALAILATPLALYGTLLIVRIALGAMDRPVQWISAVLALMNAWIVIRMVTLLIRSRLWSRVAFAVAWPVAALDAFGALGPLVSQLDGFAIPLGRGEDGTPVAITLLDVLRTLLWFGLLFWGARLLGNLLRARIEAATELSPGFRALAVKLMDVVLPLVALLIALQIAGFNLATLAVFGGALGLGVGLGLQRIVANFLAGFTLIADRSIRPGDVIEIEQTFGWVTAMQARYVALRTRDGTEILIPNDHFMSQGVVNWSRSDRVIRLHAPFGVSYRTRDLRAVRELAEDAARATRRVVPQPSPRCNLTGFGDSAVEFDLRFWIADPENGMANVTSDVLMELWDRLHEAGVEIPYPQRDLHLKSWEAPAPVRTGARRTDGAGPDR